MGRGYRPLARYACAFRLCAFGAYGFPRVPMCSTCGLRAYGPRPVMPLAPWISATASARSIKTLTLANLSRSWRCACSVRWCARPNREYILDNRARVPSRSGRSRCRWFAGGGYYRFLRYKTWASVTCIKRSSFVKKASQWCSMAVASCKASGNFNPLYFARNCADWYAMVSVIGDT